MSVLDADARISNVPGPGAQDARGPGHGALRCAMIASFSADSFGLVSCAGTGVSLLRLLTVSISFASTMLYIRARLSSSGS